MSDRFTITTRHSWSSRIGASLKGLLAGFILVVVGIGLLFWNEGRAVKTHKALHESQRVVVSINAQEAAPGMDGKLVHLFGEAQSDQTLQDDLLPISTTALKLRRDVQTYQWKETSYSEEKKNMGGDVEITTTYQYSKVWDNEKIDSSRFKQPSGHENPSEWYYKNKTWTATDIHIGEYLLSDTHKKEIDNFQSLPLPEQLTIPKGMTKTGNELYVGANTKNPAIGDQRVQFHFIPAQIYSVIGDLNNQQIVEHIASNGRSVALLQAGTHNADAMFEKAKQDNANLTWILRLIGTVLLIVAIGLILKPISVLADVVPLAGNIIEIGTGLVSFLSGLIIALVTICSAWIFYRPLVGITLILIIGALAYWLKRKSTIATHTLGAAKTSSMEDNPANLSN
ncbi:MAG TPA: TMEM43 family protein [Cellvibrio sp.]|nr:TMEM43 family protein [Cellvibrio sp.]